MKRMPEAHRAKLFSIVGIKNYEMKEEDWKWKGRVVLGGHDIRIGEGKGKRVSCFQDTSSSPSSMAAARAALAVALMKPGYVAWQSDCPNAYVQSEFKGPPTFVELPREWWPQAWIDAGMKRPVCRLLRNLYGHPQAGNGWEKHLFKMLVSVGAVPIGPVCSSVFRVAEDDLTIIVYVDDLIIVGPEEKAKSFMDKLSKVVDVDPPEVMDKYLGCRHEFVKGSGEKKGETTFITSMNEYCKLACEEFELETGWALKKAATPYAPEIAREKMDEMLEKRRAGGGLCTLHHEVNVCGPPRPARSHYSCMSTGKTDSQMGFGL